MSDAKPPEKVTVIYYEDCDADVFVSKTFYKDIKIEYISKDKFDEILKPIVDIDGDYSTYEMDKAIKETIELSKK